MPIFPNIKTRCFLYGIEMEFFAKMDLQKIRHPALKKKWTALRLEWSVLSLKCFTGIGIL